VIICVLIHCREVRGQRLLANGGNSATKRSLTRHNEQSPFIGPAQINGERYLSIQWLWFWLPKARFARRVVFHTMNLRQYYRRNGWFAVKVLPIKSAQTHILSIINITDVIFSVSQVSPNLHVSASEASGLLPPGSRERTRPDPYPGSALGRYFSKKIFQTTHSEPSQVN